MPPSTLPPSVAATGRIGPYRLEALLGRGGMACVYLARNERDGLPVAVKIVHAHLADDPEVVPMFLDEMRVAARITHPNVCEVIDVGEENGVAYLVMELLSGHTLCELIVRAWGHGGFPPWVAARIASDAARGLHAAHELVDDEGRPMQVVHRDVSPHNLIVLRHGLTKIVDFGIARCRGRIAQTTVHGRVKGKTSYIAPDHLSGPLDRRADVWSLGVVLWEALCGRRLFRAHNEFDTLRNVLEQPVPPPSEIRPELPEELERIVLWALERDRERRPATAGLFADALDLALRHAGREGSPAYMMRWLDFQWEQAPHSESGMIGLDPDTEIAITIEDATGS
jgi:serine/threonine-protein kinase